MKFDNTVKIAPSILSADFSNFGAECVAIEDQGADLVHIDVMDGHFVPNITFGANTCKSIRPFIKTVMDVHLMISPVDAFIESFVEAGADIISAHVEATPHIHRTMQAIQGFDVKAGVALNPGTPAESIEHLLDIIDLVCVMTVNPGFGGQKFIYSQVEKVKTIKKYSKAKIIIPSNDIVDFKEALIFGFLGVLKLRNEVNCLKDVTGADRDNIGGEIFEPNYTN